MPLLLAVAIVPSAALGESLTPEEKKVVDARVEKLIPFAAKLAIAPGDTVFLERTKSIAKARMTKTDLDYEGIVTGIVAPKGVVVHPRLDEFRFEPKGDKLDVVLRVAIHVDPGSSGGGRTELALRVIERTGLANTLVEDKVTLWINVGPPVKPSPRDLAADFRAYRLYSGLAAARAARMGKVGVKLPLKDLAPLPALDQLKAKGVQEVFAFLKERRRMWIAHRHLIAASQSPDSETRKSAGAYLANLDKADADVKGIPAVALTEGVPPPDTTAKVETLEPTAVEPITGGGPPPSGEGLSPVSSYEPGSEGDEETDLPESARPREPKKDEPPPKPVVKPGEEIARAPAEEETLTLSDDPFGEKQLRKVVIIPSFNRGLVLDDPNIAHGVAVRLAWANVRVQESAIASAFFFHGQVGFTQDIGAEVTVPTEYVDVDLEGSRSVFTLGNPLISAKYRLHLPDVLGRKPALTIRARWALPIAPLHNVPPTGLGAENFTREAHFSDTYAFFLEKTALGLGVNLAWQWELITTGVQLYSDYFFPISDSADQTDFFTIAYGFSIGALPLQPFVEGALQDLLGVYVEGRATSLLAGPRRTEFFMYFGIKSRILEYLEPGIWIGLPLGSVSDVSGVQIGAELRFSYDLEAVIDTGTFTREGDPLVQ
jgi:hypothetical protein